MTSSWTSLDQLIAHQNGGRTTIEWIDKDNVDWPSEHRDAACVEYDGGAIWIH
ncbi:hypothetical protein EV652_101839 [Kribbella steppae]|uniref:Uncharacterized protein n=1 Tax=Kribbella steppae TaxID=2512223 RepID=A0A4R2HWM7_9ACTN|nr:hypothetical protein [Kribbella steppae]TCO35951.1 hypothetical protein EV652_101839 [Kribbella steppae]